MLLDAITGREIFGGAERHVWLFVDPRSGQTLQPIYATAQVTQLNSEGWPAGVDGGERYGRWLKSLYQLPSGLFVVVSVKQVKAGQTKLYSTVLQMREGAPLQELHVLLSGHPRATITRATVEGRFDILDSAARAEWGITLLPGTEELYDGEIRCIARELDPGTARPRGKRVESYTTDGRTIARLVKSPRKLLLPK